MRNAIETLITECGEMFYVGNQGRFDAYACGALKNLEKEYPHIRYAVVLAYLPTGRSENEDYSDTMLPEGIERIHPKYAINWRNRWMLRQVQYVICYLSHDWGGAAQTVRTAQRQGKIVVNLHEIFRK